MATETDTTSGSAERTGVLARVDGWLDEETTVRRAIVVYAVIGVFMAFLLLPVVYMVLVTFTGRAFLYSPQLIPAVSDLSIENYRQVLSRGAFQSYFVNSVVIASSTTILTLTVGSLAGYSLSRFDYPGRDSLIVAFLGTQMLPYVLILIPFFLLMFTLNLINTRVGIILAHSVIATPLATWLLKGYFDDIPQSLDEAAKMDGCSQLDVLVRVVLPLSIPGIAVAGFYTFTVSWNDFLLVSVLSQTADTRTLPLGLQLFQSQNQVAWHLVLTAAVVTMAPVILLFALVQKWVVEGLGSGGMKGV
jgi:ABC-type glycerol-3-phosphate transport system permease component